MLRAGRVLPHREVAARTLTFGAREGSCPVMAVGHIFNVVILAGGHGAGPKSVKAPDKAIQYSGENIAAKFCTGDSGKHRAL